MDSIRKRRKQRDTAVRMGPGEYIDPRDVPSVIPWKRVLDIAAEVIPDFLPSLLESQEADIPSWIVQWRLPLEGYEGALITHFATDTRYHRKVRASEEIDPEPGFFIDSSHLRPFGGYETTWEVGKVSHPIRINAYAFELAPILQDSEGLSLLSWNPYHETRAEAVNRLRTYLDIALDEVERQTDERLRTPEVPRRHVAWFTQWKFHRQTIYGLAKANAVSENAVRNGIDNVASILGWGYRGGMADGSDTGHRTTNR